MNRKSQGPLADAGHVAAIIIPSTLMRSISVPWGQDSSLELNLPTTGPFAGAESEVVWPDLRDPVTDYQETLNHALDSPVAAERLERIVRPGTKIAIVVDDPSRWTPVRDALPIVLARLHAAGCLHEDVTISVGVGRHHAVDASAMRERVGTSIASDYRCYSPPVDDISAYVHLGSTPEGVPVRIFRPVAEADVRILIGSVLPHLQAGFGGGYKLVLPGTSHRSTLGALHRQGLEGQSDPAGLLGSCALGNPMRRAIHAAAKYLGPCWSISHLIGGPNEVFHVVAGDPEHVQDQLAVEVRRRLQAPPSVPADLIVAGNHPWPGDPMQSFKVLLQHQAACRPGGVLVGLFWTDPAEIARSFPLRILRAIALTGAPGGWTIRRLLPAAQRFMDATRSPATFMLRWARELVVDRTVLVYSPALYQQLGPRLGPVRLFADQLPMWQAAAMVLDGRRKHAGPLRLRVFPKGGLTYVSVPERPGQ
jgi:hypothetical protein